jgi:post-segregation antitoxin (ccd killing protein)
MEAKEYPKTRRAYGQIQTSVLVSQEFYRLCKEYRIKFSEAIRVGIGLILAEKGVKEYDTTLNLTRKIQMVNQKLSQTSQLFYELLGKAKAQGLDVSKYENGIQ